MESSILNKLKLERNISVKEQELNRSTENVIKQLQFKSTNLNKLKELTTTTNLTLRMEVKQKTTINRSMVNKLAKSSESDINIHKNKVSSPYVFDFTSEEDVQSRQGSDKNLFVNIMKEMDSLFDDAMKNYFIDIIHNQPEYYEEYLIQNLKVIKRMLYLFNQTSYDEMFTHKAERISKEYDINYSETYLIFDLDETLIHSEEYDESKKHLYSKILPLKYVDPLTKIEKEELLGIYIRPYCHEFIKWASENFKLILFTAAEKVYAKSVLDICDLSRYFDHILDREFTIQVKNFHVKDLSIFNLNEKLNCLIFDNNIFSFANSLQQGILISSFYSDIDDKELIDMKTYLEDFIVADKESMIDTNNSNYMYHELMLKLEFDTEVYE